MAAKAVVIRYDNEQVRVTDGNFQLDAYFMVGDDVTFPGQQAVANVVSGIVLSVAAGGWGTAIENAVIARCLELGFTVSAANCFIISPV
jgi:hypothetical protein